MAHMTVDQIVREFMSQKGNETLSKQYPRLLQMGIRGVKYLNKKQKNHYKIIRISADDLNYNDTISLPNDFIKYRQIAVCINGILVGLGRNNNLCPPTVDDCGNPVVTNAFSTENNEYDGTFWRATTDAVYSQGRDFGHGGGKNGLGYYKIYENEGYMAVTINNRTNFDELIIEYLADVETIDGEYRVHPFDEEALLDWIYWQSIRRLRTYGAGEKKEAEMDFKRSMIESAKMKQRFNLRELVSAVRTGFQSGPKI
jgi:hypothetical protein